MKSAPKNGMVGFLSRTSVTLFIWDKGLRLPKTYESGNYEGFCPTLNVGNDEVVFIRSDAGNLARLLMEFDLSVNHSFTFGQ